MKSYLPVSTAFSRYALPSISSLVLGIVLLALAPTQAMGQCAGYQIDVPDHCSCNDPSGYTAVTIKVTGGTGQTWTVKALNGLYGPVNTAALIAIGAPLTDAGGGMYTLDAKRKNTAGYWIQVTNGACDLDIRVGNLDPCATPEICYNGIDDDCDGNVDEGCLLTVPLPDGSLMYVHPTDNGKAEWGGYYYDIPALDNKTTYAAAMADFNGEGNTQIILSYLSGSGYAAKLCADLDAYGYQDWYLPAAGELNAMRQQVGNMQGGDYWSSSEYNATDAWHNGSTDRKYSRYQCRCVRK